MNERGAPGIRERNRAEITRQILDAARRRLASDGAAALSLRAVARELGMASSAVYRYVPSRDSLLTQLIVAAYDSLGLAAEEAERNVDRGDYAGRFRAVARTVRWWAIAHEHEYALIFGSPVPGYAAPEDTVAPASRVPSLLAGILADAYEAGAVSPQGPVSDRVRTAMEPVLSWFPGSDVPDELVLRGLMAWTYVFGAVSFEIFGHRHNVIAFERAQRNPFYDAEMERIVEFLGLPRS